MMFLGKRLVTIVSSTWLEDEVSLWQRQQQPQCLFILPPQQICCALLVPCFFLSFFLWNEKLSRNNGLWVLVQFTLLFLPLKPCGSTGKDYGINGQQQLQHSTHCLLKLLLSCSWLNVKGCNAVKSPNNERRPCSYGVVTGWPSPVVCACTRQNNVLNAL